MKKKPYVPTKNAAKIPWAANMKVEIPIQGPLVGESPGDITAVENAAQGVVDDVNKMEAAKATYLSAMSTGAASLNGHIAIIRQHAQHIKTNSGYNESIGLSLGIVGDDHVIVVATSKPVLKYSKVPGGYQFDFDLLDFFDAVNIYRKRPTDATFIFKATDTSSPYIDTDAQVNGTQYHAFYVLHDVEVGIVSDVVTVEV